MDIIQCISIKRKCGIVLHGGDTVSFFCYDIEYTMSDALLLLMLCGSSSQCGLLVCSVCLCNFLIILTYFRSNDDENNCFYCTIWNVLHLFN